MKFLCVRTQQSWFFVVLVVAWFVAPMPCSANITFANPEANLLMGATNAKLRVGNASKIVGWTNRSVVKTFGNNASSSWPETYADGSIVGQLGQTGLPAVNRPARTNLVEANSNVLVLASGSSDLSQLARTTSNLLLYTARTHSSSIWVLRSRADSATVSLRTMSNTLLAVSTLTRTTSNATNLFYSNLQVPTTDSIDGTQFMRYHTGHHVFHDNGTPWSIRGWVRFNDGFTIMPYASVLMDTLTTVSGPIDLRDTGLLSLNNDLYLAHNVTLTAGGYIEGTSGMGGQANTIFMGGDLTLAADSYGKVLHINGGWQTNANSGDLIIDGCGHTLSIGTNSQIFVDQNVTLTLRNMTINVSKNSFLKPAIQLAATNSKLALDNVVFDLSSDFLFDQGQIFIHDEVAVTGTSAFIYTSPKPSYIASGATWSFETGTTFSIAPSTYTDQPFTAGTATSNNFIVLADQSSALSLNNCSLKTTFTGARFTKGMVLFDNKVAIDTQAGSEISGLGSGTGLLDVVTTVSCAVFSPDGRYVAVGYTDSANEYLAVYRFNGLSSLTEIGNYSHGSSSPAAPAIAWTPDGRYVVMYIESTGNLMLFRVGATSITTLGGVGIGFSLVNSLAFSPDGGYLAVGGRGSTPLKVFRTNRMNFTEVVATNPGGNTIQVNSVAWSPDGKYLAVARHYTASPPGGTMGNIYSFNGSTLSALTSIGGWLGDSGSIAFSPDGRFIAWGFQNSIGGGGCYIYTFDGSGSAPTRIYWNLSLSNRTNALAWSPDSRYLLAGGATYYEMFRVDLANTTPMLGTPSFGTVATTVAWSPDSKYALIGGDNGTTDLMVFPVTRAATSTATQGFSNGLVFGDSARGANFDANVQLLSGAVIKAKGMIKDDSF